MPFSCTNFEISQVSTQQDKHNASFDISNVMSTVIADSTTNIVISLPISAKKATFLLSTKKDVAGTSHLFVRNFYGSSLYIKHRLIVEHTSLSHLLEVFGHIAIKSSGIICLVGSTENSCINNIGGQIRPQLRRV